MYMWYILVFSGIVVLVKFKFFSELFFEFIVEGINICLKNIEIIMFDIVIFLNYIVYNIY